MIVQTICNDSILRKFLHGVCGSLLLISCQSNEVKKAESDIAYFPMRVGATWIYDVEETTIQRTKCTDDGTVIASYELQVKVTDSLLNQEKGYTYFFLRSKRLKNTSQWIPIGTWTSNVSGNQIISNESNILYVKLVTPITNNLTWNGNAYNSQKQLNGLNEDSYKSTLVGNEYSLPSGLTFPKTITIIQNDEQSNIIYRDSRTEIYAFEVGLVYKESYLLSYFADSQLPCFAQKKTQQGIIYKQTLREFKL